MSVARLEDAKVPSFFQDSDATAATWETLGALYRQDLEARGVTAFAARKAAEAAMRVVRGFLAVYPVDVSVQDLRCVLGHLSRDLSREAAEQLRGAAVGFFTWAHQQGHLLINPAAALRQRRTGGADAPLVVPGEDRWSQALNGYIDSLASRGLKRRSIEVDLRAVQDLRAWTTKDPEHLTASDVASWFQEDGRVRSASTASDRRRRVARFFDWAHEQRLVRFNYARQLLSGMHRQRRRRSSSWTEAIAEYQRFMRAGGMSEASFKTRSSCLHRLGAHYAPRGPWDISEAMILTFMAGQDWKPEMLKSFRTSVASFYSWAAERRYVEVSPAAKLPSVRIPRARPRPVPEDVLEEALRDADERLRLMILLGACSGLRAMEIAGLDVADLDFFEGEMHVTGKGGVQRMVPMHPLVQTQLKRWLGDRSGAVFPGQIEGHVSAQYVSRLISRALGPGWSAHKLRHRFASVGFQATRDLRAMQELLGHASPRTTAIYTAVSDASLRQTVAAAGIGEGPRATRAAGRF